MSLNNRFQSGTNKDNTGRILSFDYQAPAYVTPLAIVTKTRNTIVRETITALQTININQDSGVAGNTDSPFDGDEIEFQFKNTAGGASVVTFGTGFASSGTLSVAAGKYAHARFRFYAADNLWIEISRIATV